MIEGFANLYSTFESECWARGFSYLEYEHMHGKLKQKLPKLCFKAYNLLCQSFNEQYENDKENI